jgi:hypothetical protein
MKYMANVFRKIVEKHIAMGIMGPLRTKITLWEPEAIELLWNRRTMMLENGSAHRHFLCLYCFLSEKHENNLDIIVFYQ